MAIQAALELLEEKPLEGGDGEQVWVKMRLLCGCVIEARVPADYVRDTALGERIVVGKYACPEDHPVGGQACGAGVKRSE